MVLHNGYRVKSIPAHCYPLHGYIIAYTQNPATADQSAGYGRLPLSFEEVPPSRESWEEVRLVREFAHQVDGILGFLQDIVMTRDLEVKFDEEFLAVRERLRRRVVG